MGYSIHDFEGGDLHQYFGDTYVQYRTKKGIRSGIIESFQDDDRVIIRRDDSSRTVIETDDICWKGLIHTRCITWNSCLAFVSPAGTRSYKKPPTSDNTIALVYTGRGTVPRIYGRGTNEGRVPVSLVQRYVSDDIDYPETAEKAMLLVSRFGQSPLALNSRHGVYQDQDSGTWIGLKDGVVVSRDNIVRFIRGVYNGS